MTEVADVVFQGVDTSVVQMAVKGNSLFLTGYPFLFSRWDIGSEPENPRLLAAASRDITLFSPDPPFGGWTVNFFGMGGLSVLGSFAFSSGGAGLSVINVGNTANPVEVQRYPRLTAQGEQIQDLAFVYKAIVPHPNGSGILYGFSETDKVYTLGVQGNGAVNIVSTAAYSPSGPVCCVEGATAFAGKIFVAMRSFLWRLEPSGNGLRSLGTVADFNPVNVVSTQRYLYIQHRPTSTSGSSKQAGIYIYDLSGNYVNYLPLEPLVFAVHPNDTHIYANLDDLSVKIYRIQW